MHPPAPQLGQALANPVGIDPQVMCGINDLAYKWSIRALPERAPLVEAFDSLRLGSECNRTRPTAGPLPSSLASRLPAHGRDYVFGADALDAVTAFFVDFSTGDDDGPGTESHPFQTAHRALGACRAFKAVQVALAAPCQIVLRGGRQPLTRPLDLSPADSGLTIAAFAGEQPVVSLGVELGGLQWEPAPGMGGFSAPKPGVNGVDGLAGAGLSGNITATVPGVTVLGRTGNASECQDLCGRVPLCTSWTWHDANQGAFALACLAHTDGVWQPTQQSGHTSGQRLNVWRADVSRFGLQPFAQLWRGQDGGFRRQTRARFPSANPEVFGLWTAPETGWLPGAKAWAPPVARPDAVEVDISSPLNNGTHFPTFPMGVGGPGDGFFFPPRSYWTIKDPVGGGGSTYRVPSGFVWDESTWTDKQWKRSPSGKGAIVGAYQGGHWGSWLFEVAGVDQASQTVSFGKGGFQEARGSKSGGELYVENVLEELDSPGEWFFDDEEQFLYYYPNSTSAPPQGDSMVAAQGKYAIRISGTQRQPVVNVTISGLTFAHADATYLDEFYVPSSGDYAVHRGGVVSAEGVRGLAIENSAFRSPGGNAIVVAGFARDVAISGNEIEWAGESGILVLGDCLLVDCTNGDQPRGVLIEKNLIREFGIYNQQSAAVFIAKSASVVIDRLVAFNGPRQGTVWNDGAFGGHEIKDSAIFMTVRSTGDCGPIYAWMRTVYLHDGPDGVPGLQPAESVVHNSVVLTNWHGVWPIDLDDGSAFVSARGNALAWGGFKNYLGHSKSSIGNVYVYPDAQRAPPPPESAGVPAPIAGFFTEPYCANTAGQKLGQSGWGETWANNTCYIHSSDVYSLGGCNVPDWQQLVPLTANNSFFTDSGTATFSCGLHLGMDLQEWQAIGEDAGTTVAKTPSLSAAVEAANRVLQW